MANESKIKFVTPKNPTDPIVVFDPEYDFSSVAMPLLEPSLNTTAPVDATIENQLNVFGIREPILKLNNKLIFGDQIFSLDIYIKDFLPKIEVTINDIDKNIQGTDVPGMNNVITVILTAPVEGASKKVTLDFYITDCKFFEDDSVKYTGEFKCNGLKQVKYTQIGDTELSTYEFLYKIAKELKLGFACTNKCKEVADKKWRQIYSLTYTDFIAHELKHAGIDETTIFDAWIDNFGYLVLVNLYYIFNEKVDPKQLSTNVILGETTTLQDDAIEEQHVLEVYRIISNMQETSDVNNLFVTEYHSSVNNKNILNKGTKNRYYYLDSPCDQNLLVQKHIRLIEQSADGIAGQDEYVYERLEFIGTNQNEDDVCDIYQEEIINNYKNLLYAKSIIVTLKEANYSLQRGMLVYLNIVEYNVENKQTALYNMENSAIDNESENNKKPEISPELMNQVIDENNGVINDSLSGLYYIKDITFSYSGGTRNITQTMTLIKKGLSSNLINKYTSVRV